jgi:hypothetical protein
MSRKGLSPEYFEEKMRRADFLEDIWQLGAITADAAAEIYEKLIMDMPKEGYHYPTK